jgi:hypothetical protein
MNKTRKNKKVFTEKNYNSNDGFLTTVWGPPIWHFLHTISFNYPTNPTEDIKKNYRDFILNLENILPCGKCRKNLKKNFKQLPLTMDKMESRYTFSKYIYDLHELINKMLHKKTTLTYEMVRDRYENFRAQCTQKKNKTVKKKMTEKGCVEPLVGEKSKCVLKIVPEKKKCETFDVDKKCILKKRCIKSFYDI